MIRVHGNVLFTTRFVHLCVESRPHISMHARPTHGSKGNNPPETVGLLINFLAHDAKWKANILSNSVWIHISVVGEELWVIWKV